MTYHTTIIPLSYGLQSAPLSRYLCMAVTYEFFTSLVYNSLPNASVLVFLVLPGIFYDITS